jgi:hypothetical protein
MSRRFLPVPCCLVLLASAADAGRRDDQLLRVLTPVKRATVSAHPFVNVEVRFGLAGDSRPADPSTFRARIGAADITESFTDVVEGGAVTGRHGTIDRALLKLGGRRVNRLRLKIRSVPLAGRAGARRDADKIRFRVVDAENQPPEARLLGPNLIVPDTALPFDAATSTDAESDRLAYAWDFDDDGVTDSTEATTTHVFPVGTGETTVRVTVSDGQASSTVEKTLPASPPLDPGRTPGRFLVEAGSATPPAASYLEFGAVPLGNDATRAIWIRNTDPTPTSQLRVQLELTGADFALDTTALDLGPDTSAPGTCAPPGCGEVTLTFTPTGGHRSARIVAVASAANQPVVQLLAHGYGGTAPATGPTLAAAPVFFTGLGTTIGAILPGGERVAIDNSVLTCQVPGGGPGTGDYCLRDVDCAANGGTCTGSSLRFEAVDLCGDGAGGLYLMSDEDTYTDPTNPADDERTVTIMRLDLDAGGARTGGRILDRVVAETVQMTCDGRAGPDGGRLLIAEFKTLDTFECFRCELEKLISLRKDTGARLPPLLERIDAAEGLDACDDDIDPVADLNVSADGGTVLAAFEDGGLWRIRPTPLQFTPDVFGAFQVHPDGSVLHASATDSGATGVLRLYKISPDRVATGALRLADLTPCAIFTLPNNQGQTFLAGEHPIAADRGAPGTLDSTVLVSFVTTGGVTPPRPREDPVLSPALRVQGTLAVAAPAGSDTCSVLGLVNLERPSYLTF